MKKRIWKFEASCVSLAKDNLYFFIIILATITYRMPNQDKARDAKGHDHCLRVKQYLLIDLEDLNVKKFR